MASILIGIIKYVTGATLAIDGDFRKTNELTYRALYSNPLADSV
jgi:hypothetical protein